MIALVTAGLQLLLLVFKSWTEWDAAKRKEQNDKREGWQDALKTRDLSAINAHIDRLRS